MLAWLQASNTAFRGFGGPQGLIFAEKWIEQIAKTLRLPDAAVREANMYREGELTHFGQPLERSQIRRCWEEVMASSQYGARLEAVQEFNASSR